MRIIAGQWRGRQLAAPKGDATRPTADRTREGLFSMLVSRLGSFEDLRVADFFAGSGALGLEALSRGAASCTFVEQDKLALDALRANVATLKAEADIRAQSVMALAATRDPFDLILTHRDGDDDIFVRQRKSKQVAVEVRLFFRIFHGDFSARIQQFLAFNRPAEQFTDGAT